MERTFSRTELIIEGLVHVARPFLLQYYPEDSCVLSTRISIEVLKRHGISARPLPVRVKAFNALAHSLLVEKKWEQLKTDDAAWSVALGYDTREIGKFNGHLVAYVEEQYLVDLSISQISRPERNLPLEPLHIKAGEHFKEGVAKHNTNGTDVFLFYEYALDLEDKWKRGNLWSNLGKMRPTIRRITEKVDEWILSVKPTSVEGSRHSS